MTEREVFRCTLGLRRTCELVLEVLDVAAADVLGWSAGTVARRKHDDDRQEHHRDDTADDQPRSFVDADGLGFETPLIARRSRWECNRTCGDRLRGFGGFT